MDKAKETLRDVVSYADQVVRDERLRTDILAAIGHGAETGERVRADIDAAGIKARLTGDKKLRGKLRATLDDLENAGRRLRPERRHRIRNLALVTVAAGSAAAIAPSVRRWFAHRRAELPKSGSMGVEVPV